VKSSYIAYIPYISDVTGAAIRYAPFPDGAARSALR
jgi:hypothetical protein